MNSYKNIVAAFVILTASTVMLIFTFSCKSEKPASCPYNTIPTNETAAALATAETMFATGEAVLSRIVLISTSEACACTLERCKSGEKALETALTKHPKAPKPEQLDYAKDKEKVMEFVKKHPAAMMPVIYLLDSKDNLLWKAEGTFDSARIEVALKKYTPAEN